MTNSELQNILKCYPDDMAIKFLPNHDISKENEPLDLSEDNILHTSVTAYVNEDAPESEWNAEDGEIGLGEGEQYLLINPIIF